MRDKAIELLRRVSTAAYAYGGENPKFVIEDDLLADIDAFLAAHDAAPAQDAVAQKAALADEIADYLRPQGLQRVRRSGQQVGLHAFNRRQWLARYDAIEGQS